MTHLWLSFVSFSIPVFVLSRTCSEFLHNKLEWNGRSPASSSPVCMKKYHFVWVLFEIHNTFYHRWEKSILQNIIEIHIWGTHCPILRVTKSAKSGFFLLLCHESTGSGSHWEERIDEKRQIGDRMSEPRHKKTHDLERVCKPLCVLFTSEN